ncbi:MAG TPA: zinc metalloprotease HtpX [Chloroflexota bacterium]|nr:zinc metalloprotease HtpX [Chloroflexota bacterium]
MTAKKWYGRDTQLTVRMGFTLFLLALLYAVFLAVLWSATGSGVLLVVAGAAFLLVQYFASDKLVLFSSGARLIGPQEEPELRAIVERLAQLADLPTPRLAIIETQAPNAFATGRSPKHAVVAVTRGLLAMLEPAELASVLGHEMSHIKNRDMMVLTYASLLASVASFIVQIGMWTGLGRSRGRGAGNLGAVFLVAAVVWAGSFVLLRALSRYREYAADRGSVLLTGSPSTMRSALIKVSGSMQRIPTQDLRTAQAMSAFFIVPIKTKGTIGEFFQTHPTLEHRLARLEKLEQRMNAGQRG